MNEMREMCEKDRKDVSTQLMHWKRDWESKPVRKKVMSVYKVISGLLCTLAFISFTWLLCEQYLSGRTVVSVKLERLTRDTIPAATVCYPYGLSMKGMAAKYPELRQLYDQYKATINRVSEDDYNNPELRQNLTDIYGHFERYYLSQNYTLYELFDNNITLSFNTGSRGEVDSGGRHATGAPLVIAIVDNIDGNQPYIDADPVVSFMPNIKHNLTKCFTFFSHLRPEWRDIMVNFQTMKLTISHDPLDYPAHLWDAQPFAGVMFMMHSPADVSFGGLSENYKIMASRHKYFMDFRTTMIHSLPAPYETDCRSYNPSESTDINRTRADCMLQCYMNNIGPKCSQCNPGEANEHRCHNCFMPYNIYYRKYMLETMQNYTICDKALYNHCFRQQSAHITADCGHKCANNCHFRHYYVFESNKIDRKIVADPAMDVKSVWKKYVEIRIKHNHSPDQVVTHVPEMSTVSFISSLGGLLGMWLGLSAFLILDSVLWIVRIFRIL